MSREESYESPRQAALFRRKTVEVGALLSNGIEGFLGIDAKCSNHARALTVIFTVLNLRRHAQVSRISTGELAILRIIFWGLLP